MNREHPRAPGGCIVRAVPYESACGGEDMRIVRLPGAGAARVLPQYVNDFLMQCDEFKSLQQHVSEFADYFEWSGMQIEALEGWIEPLIEAGFFVSSDELSAVISTPASPSPAAPPPISMLGIPTANRPELLARTLESFASNVRRHGRSIEFVVADSSEDPAMRLKNRDLVSSISRTGEFDARYFGLEEKRTFLSELASCSGVDPSILEFALLDPERCGFACGANRNLLLLLGAGQMITNVDDDVICRFARPAPAEDGLLVFGGCEPAERRFYPTRNGVFDAMQEIEADFIGLHEACLGIGVDAVVREKQSVEFGELDEETLLRLLRKRSRIGMTFSGHCGDSAILSPIYYLALRNENFRQLTSSKEHYTAAMAGRSDVMVMPRWAVGDMTVISGMAMGIDARCVLPPFFPVLHLEDAVFAMALWQVAPDVVSGHIPFAIRHDPPPRSAAILPADLATGPPFAVFEFARLMRAMLHSYTPGPVELTIEARLAAMARHLQGIAGAAPGDFDEYLRDLVIDNIDRSVCRVENRLGEQQSPPAYWMEDIERWIEHLRRSVKVPGFEIPLDLRAMGTDDSVRRLMQRLIGRYASLMEAWPEIWRAALKCSPLRNSR